MIERWQMLLVALATVVPLLATAPARADCVDSNADPVERLVAVAHINDERVTFFCNDNPSLVRLNNLCGSCTPIIRGRND